MVDIEGILDLLFVYLSDLGLMVTVILNRNLSVLEFLSILVKVLVESWIIRYSLDMIRELFHLLISKIAHLLDFKLLLANFLVCCSNVSLSLLNLLSFRLGFVLH